MSPKITDPHRSPNIRDITKIGGHYFTTEYRSENDGMEAMGKKRTWCNLIILQSDMAISKQESVYFHEIVHELEFQFGIGLDEKQVDALGEGIYQVLKDNGFFK